MNSGFRGRELRFNQKRREFNVRETGLQIFEGGRTYGTAGIKAGRFFQIFFYYYFYFNRLEIRDDRLVREPVQIGCPP